MLNKHELTLGAKDYIPPDSYKIKKIESIILNIFGQWGYKYVITPLLEYLPVYNDSEIGFEDDKLIKVIERETGKTMVLRADFTPQIARIVGSKMSGSHLPIRLCYSGIVVKYFKNREKKEIYQIGLELINADGINADAEIITMACEAVKKTHINDFVISISHAGFIKKLLQQLNLKNNTEIIKLLLQKDYSGINDIKGISVKQRDVLMSLFELYGEPDKVLAKAKKLFKYVELNLYLEEIEHLLRIIRDFGVHNKIILELREMHSIHYHTGIVFQIFTPGYGEELINGGRYDGFLKEYNCNMPATGFGINISALSDLTPAHKKEPSAAIIAKAFLPEELNKIRGLINKEGYSCTILYNPLNQKQIREYISNGVINFIIMKHGQGSYRIVSEQEKMISKTIDGIAACLRKNK